MEKALTAALKAASEGHGDLSTYRVELAKAIEREVPGVDPSIAIRLARQSAGDLVVGLNSSQRAVVKRLTARAIKEAWTQDELANRLAEKVGLDERGVIAVENFRQGLLKRGTPVGQARQQSRAYAARLRAQRAQVIAQTEVSRVTAEAKREMWGQWKADGLIDQYAVRVWHTHADERRCPVCKPMNGQRAAIGRNYSKGMAGPPAHPNAVLSGSTFMSYGELTEMISCSYKGPAVIVQAGTKTVTIGPNHPMLTMNGLVMAKDLRIGDQLLYDIRGDNTFATRDESDLKEVPLVENAFKTVSEVGPSSFVTAPSYDFHGDRVFCEGEVQVVFPKSGLLHVLDPVHVEQLREGDFMGAYVESFGGTGQGTTLKDCLRINLPAPSIPSGGTSSVGVSMPIVARGASDRASVDELSAVQTYVVHDHIIALSVDAVEMTHFEGTAFDASTAGLYLSNGFVVSNCRCWETLERGGVVLGKGATHVRPRAPWAE